MQKPTALAPAAPPNLIYLREHTREAHARTEALVPLQKLMTPELDLVDYGRALTGLYIFHTSLQAELAPRLRRLGSDIVPNPAVIASLRADLTWLGLGIPRASRRRVSLGRGVAAYGALYVMEGSALGGRVIGKHVSSTLGVGPNHGGAFFCGLGAAAARARWAMLTQTLAALPASTQPSLLHGALAAFTFLESVFSLRRANLTTQTGLRPTLPVMNSF